MQKKKYKTNTLTVWLVAGAVILLTVGLIVGEAAIGSGSSAASTSYTAVAPALRANDWTLGSPTSSVSVIEYGDFECPACAAYNPVVQQIVAHYGNKISFTFRNFPLTSIHVDAYPAAQAAEAAGLQGKYWQMHDLLYSKQSTWTLLPFGVGFQQYLDSQASALGLNVAQFDADMKSATVANKIQSDQNDANAMSLSYTPTFFLNYKQIQNPAGYDAFTKLIDQALASSTTQ